MRIYKNVPSISQPTSRSGFKITSGLVRIHNPITCLAIFYYVQHHYHYNIYHHGPHSNSNANRWGSLRSKQNCQVSIQQEYIYTAQIYNSTEIGPQRADAQCPGITTITVLPTSSNVKETLRQCRHTPSNIYSNLHTILLVKINIMSRLRLIC